MIHPGQADADSVNIEGGLASKGIHTPAAISNYHAESKNSARPSACEYSRFLIFTLVTASSVYGAFASFATMPSISRAHTSWNNATVFDMLNEEGRRAGRCALGRFFLRVRGALPQGGGGISLRRLGIGVAQLCIGCRPDSCNTPPGP
jgi:hypothetical protein